MQHRGRRELTVNGTVYTYRVGRKFVQVWKGTHKTIVPIHEVLGMTAEQYRIERLKLHICETCGDTACHCTKLPLTVAVTPRKLAEFLKGGN